MHKTVALKVLKLHIRSDIDISTWNYARFCARKIHCLLFGLSFWVRPILYHYRNNCDFSIFFAQEVTVFEIVAGNIILVGLS